MLKRRYIRSLKENLSFYLSSVVLTVCTLLLFYVMNIAGNAILDYADVFFASQKIEDADFTTYFPIPEEELTNYEEEYHIELEAQQYMNIETDGVTAKVFRKTDKIDLYQITVGEDVSSRDEIIISEGFARNMKVNVGDTLKIGDKNYRVSGFFLRPDYLYMLENESDSYKNITTFYLAYMTDEEFDSLSNPEVQYLVRYGTSDSREFRRDVNDTYVMRSYQSAAENNRIKMVRYQADMFVIMSYIIVCVMPLITVVLICIIMSRKIKNEQKLIGTLSAMGYTKTKIMWHYMGFAVLPGLISGIVSAILAAVLAQPYGELGLQDYEPLRIVCKLNPVIAILGVLIPTVMYGASSALITLRLLKKDTVTLLNGNYEDKSNGAKKIFSKKGRMFGQKLSFRFKFAARTLLGNPGRAFALLMGIFVGSFIVLLGLSCLDTMFYTRDNTVDNLGSYQYEYILNHLETEANYDAEPLIMTALEDEKERTVAIMGTNSDNPYLNLVDMEGNQIDLEKGFYFTSVAAQILGVKEGDKVKMFNPLSVEEKEVEVAGIVDNKMMSAIFTTQEEACEIAGLPEGSINAYMSDRELDIPEDDIMQTVAKTDMKGQIDEILTQMGAMIYLLIILGVVICVAAVYVVVNMLVTENRINISMLKVLGYENNQINGIVLRTNHILLPIGILLSIPATYASMNYFFSIGADLINMFITTHIYPYSFVLVTLFVSACYFGSLLLVSRKVKKVNMVESLKERSE